SGGGGPLDARVGRVAAMARAPAPIAGTDGVAEVAAEGRAAGRGGPDPRVLWGRTHPPPGRPAPGGGGGRAPPLGPPGGARPDPDVIVVMHAPSADLILLALSYGVRPSALVDTQLAAGFVGLGAGQSLGTLLERAIGIHLRKSESYTDWSRRPLTPAQLAYAVDDVSHLLPLADELDRRAEALGRTDWVAAEHRPRYGLDAPLTPQPDEAGRRGSTMRPGGGCGGRAA